MDYVFEAKVLKPACFKTIKTDDDQVELTDGEIFKTNKLIL